MAYISGPIRVMPVSSWSAPAMLEPAAMFLAPVRVSALPDSAISTPGPVVVQVYLSRDDAPAS